jgi:hypothetical protein
LQHGLALAAHVFQSGQPDLDDADARLDVVRDGVYRRILSTRGCQYVESFDDLPPVDPDVHGPLARPVELGFRKLQPDVVGARTNRRRHPKILEVHAITIQLLRIGTQG